MQDTAKHEHITGQLARRDLIKLGGTCLIYGAATAGVVGTTSADAAGTTAGIAVGDATVNLTKEADILIIGTASRDSPPNVPLLSAHMTPQKPIVHTNKKPRRCSSGPTMPVTLLAYQRAQNHTSSINSHVY